MKTYQLFANKADDLNNRNPIYTLRKFTPSPRWVEGHFGLVNKRRYEKQQKFARAKYEKQQAEIETTFGVTASFEPVDENPNFDSSEKFNFKVALKKGRQEEVFHFSQSYHLPQNIRGQWEQCSKEEATLAGDNAFPDLWSLLGSLAMDSDALDYSFSDWADNFGYDSDSISAKATYESCQDQTFKAKLLFDLEVLRNELEKTGYM